jgi:patatin-like phospholipase/acyl hydrolase
MTLQERINAPGPKKMLTLDGGGIRGMMTVEILAGIEAKLKDALGKGDSFVLADYFDYFAGTSTGAIIAAGLAFGLPVSTLRDFYVDQGEAMFNKNSLLKRWKAKFRDDSLAKTLKEVFGEDTDLGSDKLRSLLMVVLRNATTDSPWPLSNNPGAKYNDRSRPDCNLRLPLWQLVRASTAAPTYFPPEQIALGPREFVFVDGGVTMYNNPAFQLFLMATLDAYKLGWEPGERNMLIVSVGTGTNPGANEDLMPQEMNLLYNAASVPSALMFAALNEQDLLCRVFGKCLVGDSLDREVGTLQAGEGPLTEKLFTYLRYNAELSPAGFEKIGLEGVDPTQVQALDAVQNIPDLKKVGEAVARTYVDIADFEHFI